MHSHLKSLFVLVVLGVSGCTSVQVAPPAAAVKVDRIYIQRNPKVIVPGFVEVIVDALGRRGIPFEMVAEQADLRDRYVITYTANENWDIVMYLNHAEFRLEKNGAIIASGIFHLKGKGGLAFTKWKGTRTKLDPILDDMLREVSYDPKLASDTVATNASGISATDVPKPGTVADQSPGKSTADQLLDLKKLLDAGAITPEEYATKKKVLVDKL